MATRRNLKWKRKGTSNVSAEEPRMAARRDLEWQRRGISNDGAGGLRMATRRDLKWQHGGTLNGSAEEFRIAGRRDLEWQHGTWNVSTEGPPMAKIFIFESFTKNLYFHDFFDNLIRHCRSGRFDTSGSQKAPNMDPPKLKVWKTYQNYNSIALWNWVPV